MRTPACHQAALVAAPGALETESDPNRHTSELGVKPGDWALVPPLHSLAVEPWATLLPQASVSPPVLQLDELQ